MTKELFKRYSEVKNQIKELEKESKEINAQISAEMISDQVDKVESDFGDFYFAIRKTWQYSAEVKAKEVELEEMEAKLEEKKETEEMNGTATAIENKVLTFKAKVTK